MPVVSQLSINVTSKDTLFDIDTRERPCSTR